MEIEKPEIGIPFLFFGRGDSVKWLGIQKNKKYWKELNVSVFKGSVTINHCSCYPIEEALNNYDWTYDIPDEYMKYLPVLCNAIDIAQWKIKNET